MSYIEQLKAACATRGLTYVGVRGSFTSPICVVGEAPDADEEQSGIPFTGGSGREQDRMLKEAGIYPHDVWFTNPYKTRPPENDLDRLPELGIDVGLHELAFFEELRIYKPTIIIAAGATPMRLLCPQTRVWDRKKETWPIGKWRGSILTSPKLDWPHYVIPVQHPAFILREWTERQIAILCYAKAKEEWDFVHKYGCLNPLPSRNLIVAPSYDAAFSYLYHITESKTPISVDIEILWQRKDKRLGITPKRLVYTIAFAPSATESLSLCLWDYPVSQLAKLHSLMQKILTNNVIIGQNFTTFDSHWLATVALWPNVVNVRDTLVRHHVLYLELPHDLAFQGMQYTRQPYWKDEGRQWHATDDKSQLLRYNALDAAVTYEIFERQEEELAL